MPGLLAHYPQPEASIEHTHICGCYVISGHRSDCWVKLKSSRCDCTILEIRTSFDVVCETHKYVHIDVLTLCHCSMLSGDFCFVSFTSFRPVSMTLSMEFSMLGFSSYSTWSWHSASPPHSSCHLVSTPMSAIYHVFSFRDIVHSECKL